MPPSQPNRYRKGLLIALILLSLFLLGTVIVLSSATWFFGVPSWSLLSDGEVAFKGVGEEVWLGNPALLTEAERNAPAWNGVVHGTEDWAGLEDIELLPGERIPRIIHQTWMNDVLPEKWRDVYQECRRGLPNYTYHLWTDSSSRAFMAKHYPSFLPTFDSYKYPIQRADAIRYFVLHRFGGIYMDLDVGCKRDFAPLLSGDWDVVLMKTIPVGVSNDVMLSAKRSAFMEMTIHGLITFNHNYVTNYPTVMFSTGPMFLSAQYSLYTSSHPITPVNPTLEIRVAPKSIYGKNALPEEAPHAFFSHFYGSSWHSDDSDFILFLGKRGKDCMWVGTFVLVAGAIRLIWMRRKTVVRKSGGGLRRLVVGLESVAQGGGVQGFQAAISSSSSTGGRSPNSGTYQLLSFLPSSMLMSPTSSPPSSRPSSPSMGATAGTILPLSFDMSGSNSSAASNASPPSSPPPSALGWAFRRAADTYLLSTPATLFTASSSTSSSPGSSNQPLFSEPSSSSSDSKGTRPASHRRKSSRKGLLYFVPAFFAPHPAGGPAGASSSRGPSFNPTSGRLRSTSSARNGPSGSSTPSNGHVYHASVPETRRLVGDDGEELGSGSGSSEDEEERAEKGLGVFQTAPSSPKLDATGRKTPPPVYERRSTSAAPTPGGATIDDEWDEWGMEEEDGSRSTKGGRSI